MLEHEIPQGSKLYFGKTAKLKREIEQGASELFTSRGFEEILTPSFSFLQHQKNFSNRKIIRLNSQDNQQISLRYDSTMDTIRIITKHLARSTGAKKWFYIQPVFSYPSNEIHQIGVECLESEAFHELLELAILLFEKWNLIPFMQISNTNILQLCAEELGMSKGQILHSQIQELLQNPLLKDLIMIENIQDLESFSKNAPVFLKSELQRLLESAKSLKYDKIIISTIQDVPVNYYCDITFRAFLGNETLLLGGNYKIEHTPSCGFGIYTDHILSILHDKEHNG
ncbi:ATP phosphoribosyltransferase regulatory subunit [Helicobacter mustelae]|uniref:Putative ATP phosphoribosyltransferase regulatory subunit n=1 Tax=Helicobacter mustelae (strain ATCC 43772 / CCUG 25715 / CIP 103759 / LMG 18044 / NCTC 12198 / R85-136P) TaxID=679897 RepID=D3UG47_HELM1|nr:ATP phosphoribosyltransferase regulatory subunit [Helicobacter mustelae]CBG39468.1 Putative ATP phosphoribosyltransferase; regulatory subunit [Helicobacter mustelae 12198]SQH70981.1 ATP phosphoribosyltransferase [Helicobacter mustelae]STP12109.1 ATP phosphoribosyltransferase [Helicobacter mustelae]